MGKIIITGYPYAYPYYFRVFGYAGNKKDFIFILPKLWKAKAGKVKINLEAQEGFNTYGLSAVSYGGRGWRGLFKGWLPSLIFLLPYLKLKYKSQILYSCSEPNLLTTLFNGILARLCGLKHVLFTWQNVPPEQRMRGIKLKLSNALVRWNLRLAAGIICGNRRAEGIVRKLQPKNYNLKTIVCPLSGIDTEKFRPSPLTANHWKDKLGIGNGKMILFYGALEKRKGLDVLLRAFRILNQKLTTMSYKLVLVGTGPEKENLKLQTTNRKLQTNTVFLDWMPNNELPALLNAADVFVYPSVPFGGWEEQFGYAMAEASASEVPVVATKTGSIEEVVLDGQSGVLVEPNDSEQLAEALLKILQDPILSKQMGEAGRRYVVVNFGHQVVAEKIMRFLETI
ncbi:MAG: hypothetical protein A3I92_02885 [Candidatus Yanofskybacteria bacterium RIFCSPLOWO2_02_FULL_43_10b]|uniref:Glycosyl transferase family 1 domain-containing protein n=1 Tax=Candidatus Yanofskybacteria bacterium RIFCSPLOWO2_02_FULL_43_10b TaxID=1802704 RepID=A0A1F8H2P4_9BACT|nr:MAG: hypothetical protein A3I92_02885 [Candidatus Yanofskybacteria bacterium RIFCSPLOWO2_02_FULL_43_10b]